MNQRTSSPRELTVERGLWPRPKRFERDEGSLAVARFVFDAPRELELAVRAFEERVAPRLARTTSTSTLVRVRTTSLASASERYRLRVHATGVEIDADGLAGARHALATLQQLVRLAPCTSPPSPVSSAVELPRCAIDDHPDLAERGVMLDVSRTKVPELATLFAVVDRMAEMKLNRLQLYTEHAFAYPGHEAVWRDSSAFTGAEIEALDARCRARGIELVPNQQSFGHMHRWLVHDRYRDLAEVPEGVEHAFSIAKEPYGLCATDPRSLALLAELYDELFPHFTSREVNVGLDETFDLGMGRSRAACAARGKHRVYLEYLRAVHALVTARGKRMQFWGDIVLEAPELVAELPRDAVAMEWGYDADHPFDAHARTFAESGLAFHVCPGTSSWQSVLGRTDNMLANVRSAARAALEHGARGMLVTDWGDRGHLQPLSVSWPGIVHAAGSAWNVASADDEQAELAALLDLHVFEDDARVLGETLLDFGRAGDASGAVSTNGSPLFFLLAFAPNGFPHPRVAGATIEGFGRARAHVARGRERLAHARPACADGAIVVDELTWGATLLELACRFGVARIEGLDERTRRELRDAFARAIDGHARTWRARNRPGGLVESRGWLERAARVLETLPSAS